MSETDERFRQLENEIERRLLERFAALRDEFDRLRLEADRRWAGFLTRFDQDFTGIVPLDLIPAPPPPEPAPAQRPPSGHVSLAEVRSLDEGDNQVEVLRRFLDLCRRHASRAVLFVARSGSLEAWKAVGFSGRGGNDEAIRRISVPLDDGALRRILEGTPARLPGDNPLSRALSVRDASGVVVVPMVVREKTSGLVYADSAEDAEEDFDPDAIAVLTYLAGAVVDRLSTRRLRPSPSLKTIEEIEEVELQEAPPAAEEIPAEEPAREEEARELELATESAQETPPPSFAATPPAEAPAAPMPRPAPPEEPAAPESATRSAWQADVEPPPMPRGVEAPPRAEPTEAPPPPLSATTRRLAGPLAQADGDERREEARRFARLLVSEIKLYNERAVLEGRERKDLYQRLREDIDRSRQMYDERIPEDVRSNSNFFYEEMVRVLADGRPEALGL